MKVATSIVLSLGLLAATMAASTPAPAQVTDPDYSILLFTKTAGFRHANIETGVAAIVALGEANNVQVDHTEDAAVFTDENLAQYAAVVWFSTTGDVLDADQQAAFERYIQSGGGYAGIHAASDTEYGWPWYGGLVGAYFQGHPAKQTATIVVEDPAHPSTSHLEAEWTRFDEWYNFQSNPRSDVHVLASVDESTYDAGGSAMGIDHPIVWCHDYDGGRAWYTGVADTAESFAEPEFLDHLWGGIETAAGVVPADCGASDPDNFQKVAVDDNTSNPMELEVAPDGRVFYVDRNGDVRIVRPDGTVTTAGSLDVYTGQEFGLLGLALDPDFATNGWLYLYYSPNDSVAHDLLSRFTMNGDTLDLASEQVVLEIETQRDQCCHAGGALEFDTAGDLYVATGDNTNPFASSGYTPIDERPGRSAWDAQGTSANSNNLNGKLLRITPTDDGSYTIPAGNLFDEAADTTDQTRPEIYAMGFRNPFRVGIDPLTNKLMVADFGPDAGSSNPNRGPDGRVEWNIVDAPGFYGWPYCVDENTPYIDYDFATNTSGAAFDCTNGPTNDSPNNDGLTQLPAPIGSEIWYGKSSTGVPEIGTGGAPMAGGVYRYDPDLDSEVKWPAYWDGKAIFGEWNRTTNGMFSFQLDAAVTDVVKVNQLFPGETFRRLHAFEWGPDGALYFIEWGSGFGGNNADSGVYKLEYVGASRTPIARLSADVTSGALPLTVNFSAAGSIDPDGGPVTYAWDFDGDGSTDSTELAPTHTYTTPGDFAVQLTVTDDEAASASSTITITAGNTAPEIVVIAPINGGFFSFGDVLTYEVVVTDVEDGVVDCADVVTQPALGHDEHAHGYEQYTGCSGSFPLPGDEGHVGANIFGIVTVTYTDGGGDGGAGPLTTQEIVELRVKHTEAEYYAETGRVADGTGGDNPGVQTENTSDVDGGQNIGFISDGDWWSLEPADLLNIDSVDVRVASGSGGGRLEIRTDAPDGPLVGEVTFPGTGGWQSWQTVNIPLVDDVRSSAVYFVARDPGAGSGFLFNVNWMEFNGKGITDNEAPEITELSATPTQGEAPLAVSFSAAATDPEGDEPLTYAWAFGDGGSADGAAVEHTYTDPGDYTATLTVTDARGAANSGTVAVTVTPPPTLQCFAGRSDDFLGTTLDRDRWEVLRENQELRVEGSELVIPLTATDIYGGNNTDTPNFVLQPLPDGAFTATTKLTLQAYDAYEQAGLLLYEDDDNYVKMVFEGRDTNQANPASRVFQFVGELGGSPTEVNTAALGAAYPDTVYVRLTGDGTTITGWYSDDGADWTQMAASAAVADYENLRIGLFALSGNNRPSDQEAAFDFFTFTPDDSVEPVDPDDPFDGTELDLCRWRDSVRLDEAALTVADGALTIDTGPGDIFRGGNSDPANLILQPAPEGDWTIETKLDASAFDERYQQAGLMAYVDDDNYVKFDFITDNVAGQAVTRRIELRSEVDSDIVGAQPNASNLATGEWWLRLTKQGDTFSGEYSEDGVTWTAMADTVSNAGVAANGSIGLFAFGVNQTASKPASFDGLTVVDDSDTTPPVAKAALLGAFSGEFMPAVGSNVTGTAELIVVEGQTTAVVDLAGLLPNTTYTGHLHEGVCGAAGGHYQDDPDGPAAPPNELWLLDDPSLPSAGFVTDSEGKASVSNTANWTASGTAQVLMIHLGATGVMRGCATVDTSASGVDVLITATDDSDGQIYIEYKLDDQVDWSEYTARLDVDEPGDHSVQFRASDVSGNVSEVGEVTFTIAEPVVPLELTTTVAPAEPDGDNGWYVTPVTITGEANDEAATVEVNVDGGGWVEAPDGSVVVDTDGEHTVRIRAVRGAETVEADPVAFQIDGTPPDLEVSGIANNAVFEAGSADEVTWTFDDATSGFRWERVRLDGQRIDQDLPSGGPFVPGELAPGRYRLWIRIFDQARNHSTQAFWFDVVDTTPPELTVAGITHGEAYGDSSVLALEADAVDAVSPVVVVHMLVDGEALASGTPPLSVPLRLWELDLGSHVLAIRVADGAGNEAVEQIDFTVGTSTGDILALLDHFEDTGELTSREARRVRSKVERAERLIDRGRLEPARRALLQAIERAAVVVDPDVREVLVRDLVAELVKTLPVSA